VLNGLLLDEAPNGMYAITQIDDNLRDEIKPGVIFTLKQIKGYEQTKEQNALFPYYMVYVADDGEVKLPFLRAKKILDYYKKLCSGQNKVIKELVGEFNLSTDDGKNINKHNLTIQWN